MPSACYYIERDAKIIMSMLQGRDFPIPFTKMSGTGNDFIVIDHRQPL